MSEPLEKAVTYDAVHGGQDAQGAQMMSSDQGNNQIYDDHSEATILPSETGLTHSPSIHMESKQHPKNWWKYHRRSRIVITLWYAMDFAL